MRTAARKRRGWRALAGCLLLGAACRTGEVAPVAAPAPPPVVRPEVARPEARAVALGVILPRTGAEDLTIYADYVREGIELAVERFRGEGGRRVELAVRDDSGGVAGAARATLDLESTGVLAIVGPLLGDAFAAIASSRTDTVLPILSPTASDLPSRSANAYSLNAIDRRGAEALAEWAVRRGSTALAMLYPRDPAYAALASAFRAEAERIGARIVADIAYAPATTTFQADINTLRAARPAAVFVPAPERQIRQLAPQLRYYGLTNVTVLGNEAWVSAEVLRTVAAGTLEGVVVATPMPPDSSLTGWADFVREYEARFRRTLDNPYPALGYDAASLALEGIRRAGGRREEVAVALRGIRDFRGATGLLSIENGRITRRPFLVRIRAGKPELISSGGGP